MSAQRSLGPWGFHRVTYQACTTYYLFYKRRKEFLQSSRLSLLLVSHQVCNGMDCSPPGSSGHGIFQARILGWVAMPSSRGTEPASLMFPALTGGFFTTSATWEAHICHILLAYATYYICCCFSISVVSNWLEKSVCRSTLRTGSGRTDWFLVGKGVQQGCILSPYLFNFYAKYIMKNARLDEPQARIKIARRNISNLRYTDEPPFWQKIKRK